MVSSFAVMICCVLILQRLFALSKASGQKAAQYVLQQYPQNFANDPADPQIEVRFSIYSSIILFVVFLLLVCHIRW